MICGASSIARRTGASLERSRHRAPVRGARRRVRACGDSGRCAAAGDVAATRSTYVVNRNINYTNVCYFRCQFCAFSKGKLSENLRGRPYDLDLDEIERRTLEAWERGATEVCLQGGIHPDYTGATYLDICRASRRRSPTCTCMPSRRWKCGRAPPR